MMLTIQRGKPEGKGPSEAAMSRVRWDSFSNFEEGDYAPWFLRTSAPSQVPAGKAIVLTPRGQQRILVSHSDDPVFSDKLRSKLEDLFVVGREKELSRRRQWRR